MGMHNWESEAEMVLPAHWSMRVQKTVYQKLYGNRAATSKVMQFVHTVVVKLTPGSM